MLSGYYTIASGMMANQKHLDVISNNLVNAQTTGYRAGRATFSSFEMELMSVMQNGQQTVLGDGVGAPIVLIDGERTLFQPGLLESTGRNLDVAINGEGFFNVTGQDGTTYLTRNGGFDLDTEGYLVLPGVGRVMGTNGYIRATNADVQVAADGTVLSATGAQLGKILITAPTDYTTLERTPNGMFTSAAALPTPTQYALVQHNLEKSNVDLNTELTNLIAAQRAFQSCSSALSTIDTINRKAAQQIAAV
jgi:flagellar basal-body rod protein FlgG